MLCPRGDQTESPFRARSMLQRMHSKQASTSVVNTLFSQKKQPTVFDRKFSLSQGWHGGLYVKET